MDIAQKKQELLAVDREFSNYSAENGAPDAFAKYAEEAVIVIHRGAAPLFGHESLVKSFDGFPPNARLIWEPFHADISSSGDMGYTVGHYTMTSVDSTAESKATEGNYVTIWKIQPDDSWKFVFDTGNEGPPPKK